MPKVKRLIVLGSTGSIGTQVMEVVRRHPQKFRAVALAANSRMEVLSRQAREFGVRALGVGQGQEAEVKKHLRGFPGIRIFPGEVGLCRLAGLPQADMVVNALVGAAGLLPTLAAIEAGHEVALANKETLVAGGQIVMAEARKRGVKIIPIDSEHVALHQCLDGRDPGTVRRLILTASGGPFRGRSRERLRRVTARHALRHPTWRMGPKITIDSATLMNKGLEVIEAAHLFQIPLERIEVVVHPESIVHSLVEFVDGSVLAQLALPDMRLPIQYALTWPQRWPSLVSSVSLADIGRLTFHRPDPATFRCLQLAYAAGQAGGTMPAVMNAANEVAVHLFLEGRLSFLGIPDLILKTMDEVPHCRTADIDDILRADAQARETARRLVRDIN